MREGDFAMSSVGIHPPKTPVTKGSSGIAKATLPNVCKMPGPPAPFVPAPLPNIAKSGSSPKGYTKKVKIEGKTVAILGATFKSMGDIASKGTGGGLISANTHGPAKFITPGSLTVRFEGKSVHLLGEPMLNNCGASGVPPNTGATMMGVKQGDAPVASIKAALKKIVCECNRQVQQAPPKKKQKTCAQLGTEKHNCCEKAIQAMNSPQIDGESGYGKPPNYAPISGPKPAHPPRGTSWPDCTITDTNGRKGFVDFKFKCPPNTPVRKKKKGGHNWIKTKSSSPGRWPTWTEYKDGSNQKEKYEAVGKKQNPPITKKPVIIDNKGCKK